MKTPIVIIEDDRNIALGLQAIFEGEGFSVHVCHRGDAALSLVVKEQPALVILDVMLPGRSGYDVCKEIRKHGINTPIMMLTAKGQEIDKVVGLDLGADDYVVKPFGVRELIARARALLRRTCHNGSARPSPFTIGSCTIDPSTFQVSRGAKREQLTARELKLLELFFNHQGQVLSRERLLNEVWGQHYYGTTRALDQVIVQLRKKLGDTPEPAHLQTVHGVGYKLVP